MMDNNMTHEFASSRQREDDDQTSDDSKSNEKCADKNKSDDETSASSDDSTKCSICLDTVNSSVMQSLPCAHVFHEGCIDDWLRMSNVCPICRWPITRNSLDSSRMVIDASMPDSETDSDSEEINDGVLGNYFRIRGIFRSRETFENSDVHDESADRDSEDWSICVHTEDDIDNLLLEVSSNDDPELEQTNDDPELEQTNDDPESDE